jgi:hypothetical protein
MEHALVNNLEIEPCREKERTEFSLSGERVPNAIN